MNKRITLGFVLLFLSCTNNSIETTETNNDSIDIKQEIVLNNDRGKENIKKIIFSTEDLLSANFVLADDINKKVSLTEYYDNGAYYAFLLLPKYEKYDVIIEFIQGDENDMYYLCILRSGEINVNKGLNISPYWSAPSDDEHFWEKKKIEIHDDYTIHIDTEKSEEGVVQKFTKYYRINDKGEFYEVKESDL
ncbi:hypothetical protein FACS189437_09630 [Bacteroidia bacterium]|nr:hypothetical protein FACS189437_09630 [Bacteroidia bacterium]